MVSLWSLSIGVEIIFTTNELVDRIKNLINIYIYINVDCRFLRLSLVSLYLCPFPVFLTLSHFASLSENYACIYMSL